MQNGIGFGLSRSTKVMHFPGKPEEEAMEEFMTRWDLAHTNLVGLKGNTWSEQQLGWMLHSKVQRVQVLNHDIEAWRLLPDEAKTHTWLRKRIKDRLEMWRADKNIDEASMWVSRQAFSSGYAAMPAQQGSYRAPVNRRSAYADDRPRSSSPGAGNGYGRGISVGRGRDGLSQAGRADDPKNRYGSKSPFGKRGVCYPYTRGTCPMTAADCKHSHDIYLYSQAEEVLKKAGYCFEHFRYGNCRNDKCKMLHEAIPSSIREAFETVEIEQKETRPSSPHADGEGPSFR